MFMNIIIGASGQVGGAVAAGLLKKGKPVKAVVRDERKVSELKGQGAEVAVADAFDKEALIKAFAKGDTLFAITPETGQSDDVLGDTRKMLDNYREAVKAAGIKKIMALSSIGAQYDQGTGNLLMSHMLEAAFSNLDVKMTCIRPAYYFSNWLFHLDTVREKGILPSFLPPDMKIPMVSPMDVAKKVVEIMTSPNLASDRYEIHGRMTYSPEDIARAYAKALNREVTVQEIPRDEWENTLKEAGFTTDAIRNFIEMTDAVIDGRKLSETGEVIVFPGKSRLNEYIAEAIAARP
ncbi:putative nucleoside-diphosphate-sugar epimerase [Pedobacter sp. BAL39]|nr:putative nucleoside-diphosphate-sugar epimerase [Pedobacter sp. BAL39]